MRSLFWMNILCKMPKVNLIIRIKCIPLGVKVSGILIRQVSNKGKAEYVKQFSSDTRFHFVLSTYCC